MLRVVSCVIMVFYQLRHSLILVPLVLDSIPYMIIQNRHKNMAHLQSSVFKLSKDLIDSIHEEGIVAYTS